MTPKLGRRDRAGERGCRRHRRNQAMLLDIGILLGAYMFTRMAHLLGRDDVGMIVKGFAAITMIIAIISSFDLLLRSSTVQFSDIDSIFEDDDEIVDCVLPSQGEIMTTRQICRSNGGKVIP
jgi:hypothetical protein